MLVQGQDPVYLEYFFNKIFWASNFNSFTPSCLVMKISVKFGKFPQIFIFFKTLMPAQNVKNIFANTGEISRVNMA